MDQESTKKVAEKPQFDEDDDDFEEFKLESRPLA